MARPARLPYHGGHDQSVRSRRPVDERAAPAGRPSAPAKARRCRRPGSPRRAGGHADAHAVERPAAEHDPVGAAGLRQDHHRAPARQRDEARVRAALGDLLRRAGPAQSVRSRQGAARAGPRHAAVHRRDPSLQSLAAGQLPAAHGGRHDHAGRRDHREPVVRAQRRRAVARQRAGAQPARRGRARRRSLPAPKPRRAARCRSTPTPAPP